MNILSKLERKYGKYAIKNLMMYMIIGYAVMWMIMSFNATFYYKYLIPDVSLILKGQVWRIITMIFMPPSMSDNILFLAINLYFLYFIGNVIRNMWGEFTLNLIYFSGILLHIVMMFVLYAFGINIVMAPFNVAGGTVAGDMGTIYGSYYLIMAMFMLVGMCNGDAIVLLFFIIPLKMRWLAYVTMGLLGATVVFGFGYHFRIFTDGDFFVGLFKCGVYPGIVPAVSAIISIVLFFIFFYLCSGYHVPRSVKKRQNNYDKKIKQAEIKSRVHKCAVCGRTNKDDPTLTFRFCSKCNGTYEYCQDHLFTHEHIK